LGSMLMALCLTISLLRDGKVLQTKVTLEAVQ
jgi:hypothetical protein